MKDNPRSAPTRLAAAGVLPQSRHARRRCARETAARRRRRARAPQARMCLSAAGLAIGLGDRDRAGKLTNDAAEHRAKQRRRSNSPPPARSRRSANPRRPSCRPSVAWKTPASRGRHAGQPDLLMQAAWIALPRRERTAQAGKAEESPHRAGRDEAPAPKPSSSSATRPWNSPPPAHRSSTPAWQAEDADLISLGVKSLERAPRSAARCAEHSPRSRVSPTASPAIWRARSAR